MILVWSSQTALRVPRKKIIELVRYVGRREAAAIAEIDVAVVTGREIAAFNRRHLGRRGSTDVLSFDLSESLAGGIRGQIVICGEVAVRQARAHHSGPHRELMLYVVHGLLHLMEYDDGTEAEAEKMLARGEELLAEFLEGTR